MREHGTLHVPDVRAQNDFPTRGFCRRVSHLLSRSPSSAGGTHWSTGRTSHGGAPLTPAQIKLLETFADQAVIAHRERAAVPRTQRVVGAADRDERDLGVIASSPTDIQPVLDAVAENAARLCDANDAVIYHVDGDVLQRVAICGSIPIRSTPLRLTRGTTAGRAVVDRQTTHIHDIDARPETEFPDIDKAGTGGGAVPERGSPSRCSVKVSQLEPF